MTLANDIYNKALVLMDAQSDNDTSEYQLKSVPILNTLCNDLYPFSDTLVEPDSPNRHPVCPEIESLSDEMALDDKICRQIMPWGLAGLLLMDENPSTAQFLWSRYEELFEQLKRGVGERINGSSDIIDVYGGGDGEDGKGGKSNFYYNRFTVWG